MGLNKLTNHIFYLEHNPEVDRPMLGYVKGDKYSLAIDAGYSLSHVQDFYNAIDLNKLKNYGQEYGNYLAKTFELINICIPNEYNTKDSSDTYQQYGPFTLNSIIKKLISNG